MDYKKYVTLRDGSKELLELANVYDSISSDTIRKLLAEPDSNVVNPLLGEVTEIINNKYLADDADGLKQNEKWYAKGYNQCLKELLKEISGISA